MLATVNCWLPFEYKRLQFALLPLVSVKTTEALEPEQMEAPVHDTLAATPWVTTISFAAEVVLQDPLLAVIV